MKMGVLPPVFDHCGVFHLFQQLGIAEAVPAMCAYDYTMAEKTGTIFTRQYTIAGGGPTVIATIRKDKYIKSKLPAAPWF